MQHGVKSKIATPHQGDLIYQLKHIFQDEFPQENARKNTAFTDPHSGNYKEVDVWIPKFNIGFEFQDSYHYVTTWYNQLSKEAILESDSIKQSLAQKSGSSLVIIPCWWDGNSDSLLATIYFQRPDLSFSNLSSSIPIPLNPPLGYFVDMELPGVGELMVATFLRDNTSELASIQFEPGKWWVGEKYDGIRFCWNSKNKVIYTRQGRPLSLLPEIVGSLPSLFLDGEIWFGRGQFQDTSALSYDVCENVLWEYIRLVAFDVPSLADHNLEFEERYTRLIDNSPSHTFIVAPRLLFKHYKQVLAAVAQIIADGGEGVIMRKCGSFYVNGKSPMLVKIKASQGDREAIVVAVGDDKSVELQMPEGTRFVVAADDVSIPTPRVGEIVSFAFEAQSLRRDAPPVAPVIFRVRTDLAWGEVVSCAAQESEAFNERPLGHGTTSQIRQLLEEYARNRNLDPLLPSSWYNVPVSDILQLKGGSTILRKVKGGMFGVLQHAFPDVAFDHSQFAFPKYLWTEIKNRRHFFERFARENFFDPLLAEQWYSQSREKIMAQKGIKGVLEYHGGSLHAALVDLFPDVAIDKSKLFTKKDPWEDPKIRRQFLENYAEQHGFDPLDPEGWKKQTREEIMTTQGSSNVIRFHNNSVSNALRDLLPNIKFNTSGPLVMQNNWSEKKNRKIFFENYAKENGFDVYNPNEWYSQRYERILATKGASKVMRYYSGRVSAALLDLFPNIGLNKFKFKKDGIQNKNS